MNKILIQLITELNRIIKLKNKSYIDLTLNKQCILILNLLIFEGILLSYRTIENKKTRVFLRNDVNGMSNNSLKNCDNFYQNKYTFKKKSFRNIILNKRTIYKDYKSLNKSYNKKYSLHIISTTKGFMSSKKAIMNKIGGLVYIQINL